MKSILNLFFNLFICLLVLSILLPGCLYKTTTVPYTTTKKVPYEGYEYKTTYEKKMVEEEYKIDEYELVPPYFPYRNKNTKIAVLPFTSSVSSRDNAGIELAVEIEYELIKRVEDWQNKSPSEIKMSMYRFVESPDIGGISKVDIDNWYNRNRRPRYEIVDRTELEMMLQEANITSSNYMSKLRANITAIDGLIIGHVRELTSNTVSFIFKVVDVRTSKIIFTNRYEGNYNDQINGAVDAFFYNIKATGNKVTEYKKVYKEVPVKEKVSVTKYKTEKVEKTRKVKKVDSASLFLWAGLIGVYIYVHNKNKKEREERGY